MNIVLTGFMCTGKTVVGLELSKRLNMEYIDTDSEIEKVVGKKIVNIFAKYGETFFRNLEHKVILGISKKNNCVISTGGGVVLRKDNLDNLRVNGKIINLTAKPETVFERLKKQPGMRPLLNKPNPMKEIVNLIKSREQFYENCDLQIKTDSLTVEEIVEKIVEFINKMS